MIWASGIKPWALLVGLFSLLGTASALAWHPIYALFLLFIALSCILEMDHLKIRLHWRKWGSPVFLFALAIGSLSLLSTLWRAVPTELPQERLEGEGIFRIENLKIVHSPFNRSYCYKGV